MKPKVLVLKTDGINRDEEMAYAFKIAGGNADIIHVNDLRSGKVKLKKYHIIGIPGGFSYGDDVVSGKILAIELTSFLSEELKKFVERKNTLIIGVCNGFQVLVRTGLVPFGFAQGKPLQMQTTLTNNDSGHFECRWINLRIEPDSRCVFLNSNFGHPGRNEVTERSHGDFSSPQATRNDIISLPVAHGEGKFFSDNKTIEEIEKQNLVAFRYVDDNGNPTQEYPQNPNGAINAIGGICDTTGRVLGLMPHPECFVRIEQHPNWRRKKLTHPHGLPLFKNMVQYVKNA